MADDYILHYGVGADDNPPGRGSGRYPKGSGENPNQHEGASPYTDFLDRVDRYKKAGYSDTEIAHLMDMSTGEFRAEKTKAKNERKAGQIARYEAYKQKGVSRNEIARILDVPEATLRSWDDAEKRRKMTMGQQTANFLREQMNNADYIDIGKSVEMELGVSRTKFDEAISILKEEGYQTFTYDIPQTTNKGKVVKTKVLAHPDVKFNDYYGYYDKNGKWVKTEDPSKIKTLTDYISHDDGESFDPKYVYPKSMDSSRMAIRYAEDGGLEKDGVVEIRKGVKDLDLNGSLYSQVRILVDGTHYIKGMAVYSDDIPAGKDIIFNTNKKKGTPLEKVLKPISDEDPKNPFGSLIKPMTDDNKGGQYYYIDKDGKKQLSLINKRADEGDWDKWKDTIASQFLGKQPEGLIKKQLGVTKAEAKQDYEEIISLTNPTVKRILLNKFADQCDKAAIELKAAALPRQKYQVILPLTTIKDNEIYAPNFNPGEKVALIRYPHGGLFEIPILTVNNRNAEGQKMIGKTPMDAVGINAKVAGILSGADFDGDTVMVIPLSQKVQIKNKAPLDGLKGFDPKAEYGGKPAGTFKHMTKGGTQAEMGKISNLITDMTLQGAPDEELVRAVKHSMVVIDAYKHDLDYKQSYIDNNIYALKKKYQGTYDENGKLHMGAATLLSRAKNDESVPKRQGQPRVNIKGKDWYDPDRPEGALIYKTSDKATYVDKNGKTITKTQRSTKMAEHDDAYDLVSKARTKPELLYADYANYMKTLANEARKEAVATGRSKYNASARREYQEEVSSLLVKLNTAKKNEPRERTAQRLANTEVAKIEADNPGIEKAELKKIKQRKLTEARALVGAKRTPIEITDREWEAIQKGAISDTQLTNIINGMDDDKLKKLAMPKAESRGLSNAKVARMKAMQNAGYSTSEIAQALGVSNSTVQKYLRGE